MKVRRIWPGLLAAGSFAGLHFVAFPPVSIAEAGYICLTPLALWAMTAPNWRWFLGAVFAGGLLSWTALLAWLANISQHATLLQSFFLGLGWPLLAGVMALFPLAWASLVRAIAPQAVRRGFALRLIAWLELAGAWVVLEWIRTWLLTGFPWLPLSVSQWNRPALLPVTTVTGGWGLSFLLVFFGVALASYGYRLFTRREEGGGMRRVSPELYLAVGAVLLASLSWFWLGSGERDWRTLGHVAFVQPATEAPPTWTAEDVRATLATVERISRNLALPGAPEIRAGEYYDLGAGRADLVLWPEAVLPTATIGIGWMEAWIERVARDLETPLLAASMAVDRESDDWFNIVVLVDPAQGQSERFYAKRKLVPFGEFFPFSEQLGDLRGILPFTDSFARGTDPAPITLAIRGEPVAFGALICYESIFPELAWESVRAGAQVLLVATTNSWYGSPTMSLQHRAHAVLRAVETRRPVLQVAKTGWTGWIDEYGSLRASFAGPTGKLDLPGGAVLEVETDARFRETLTPYVRWGDWWVGVAAGLVFFSGWVRLRTKESRAGVMDRDE